jgi:hypothetical protein
VALDEREPLTGAVVVELGRVESAAVQERGSGGPVRGIIAVFATNW